MEPYQVQNIIEMLIVSGTVILLAFSPLPRALGKLLMHGRTPLPGSLPPADPRLDDLADDNAMLRRQLEEMQERLQFAERMLAQGRDKQALPGAR